VDQDNVNAVRNSPMPLSVRCVVGFILGAFVGAMVGCAGFVLKYGGMGHGGTSTDWNKVASDAMGTGALACAVLGALLAMVISPAKSERPKHGDVDNQ